MTRVEIQNQKRKYWRERAAEVGSCTQPAHHWLIDNKTARGYCKHCNKTRLFPMRLDETSLDSWTGSLADEDSNVGVI